MIGLVPFTGFGPDPSTSIPFQIRVVDGQIGDWTGGPRIKEKKIQGSSRVNIRRMGRDPYTVQFQLRLASIEDLDRLDAMQGNVSTLRYMWGVTKTVGGHFEHILDDDYLVIPGVRLMALDDPRVFNNGTARTTATFLKPYGGGA